MKPENDRLGRLRDFALVSVGVPSLTAAALLGYAAFRFGALLQSYGVTRAWLYASLLGLVGAACGAAYALLPAPRTGGR